MVNNVIIRNIFYFFILLIYSNIIYSSSSYIYYPSFKQIAEQLLYNSTLPDCTRFICKQTKTQADFSDFDLLNDYVFKLASYKKNSSSHGPYLISSTGIYRGKRIRYYNRYIDQFLGIYYGEVPEPLQKPIKKRFNYTLQNATKFTPCCLQSVAMAENLSYGSFVMQRSFNNDCLSLNIYRADLRYGEKRKAIMLFSHGGSNQLGGGSLFDGSILASEGDIIVITMNFRLNYHGFLSSGDNRVKGNYGLWDQLLAVEWIYENAHLFGGDRNRITLAGHSAGAGNVMLIPASPHCHGMIRRVISQSGTGLAPWSINRNPMKLLERLTKEFGCKTSSSNDITECIYKLLESNHEDIYRLHLSLNIADDNPYPVIDYDFMNETMEKVLQSDAFKNIDFLTGVTLNEGLYFAEYHIKHLYSGLHNQSASMARPRLDSSNNVLPSDVVSIENKDDDMKKNVDTAPTYDAFFLFEKFLNSNYIEKYIDANFKYSQCFIDDVKKKYGSSENDNMTNQLKLYIDLVSDLMFNFHMVRCLDLRTKKANKNSTNYAYIYSHRPTFKVKSIFRDQVKLLPHVIGHFAELDYVFGVPLARNFSRIHRNVNMSYYNYSIDEEYFSRQLIRYWSNFIKTGNPNEDLFYVDNYNPKWKSYQETDHNYIYFQLNNIHNEKNYFDSMYNFWLECFQIETRGGCQKTKIKKHLTGFLVLLFVLLITLIIVFSWKHFQKKKPGHLLSYQSPTFSIPYPDSVSA